MELFYRKFGSGHPLIILHGLYGSSDNWVSIAKMLSTNFEVFLPDQRNHGHSPHSEEHNYILLSNDIFEFTTHHQIDKAIIAGHSMGGKTAMFLAVNHPEIFSSLIVIDISTRAYGFSSSDHAFHQTIIDALLSIDLKTVNKREEVLESLNQKIGNQKIAHFLMKNLYRKTPNSFDWRLNISAIKNNFENILTGLNENDFNTENQITHFPVLFIKAENSDYITVDDVPKIKKIFPFAEFVSIKNASHWLHAEQPELLVKNILYFTVN